MPPRLLYALALLVAGSLVISWFNRRKKSVTWKGVVTAIRHQRQNVTSDADRRDEDWVTVFYRTDQGREGRFKIRYMFFRDFYDGLADGDRLHKRPGDFVARRDNSENSAETESGENEVRSEEAAA